MTTWNLVYQVLFFCSHTPYLFLNAYFLWRMLNTGTHRKCISIVNCSCVPKPVIRILCASLAYKERALQIHSIFGISVPLSTAQSMAITCTICSLHIYWFGHRIATFVMHCINRVPCTCGTKFSREFNFADWKDWFFLLGINFCDFPVVMFKWN